MNQHGIRSRFSTIGGRAIRLAVLLPILSSTASATGPDWGKVQQEAIAALAGYLRTDTYNPPGRTVESVRYLQSILEAEGIEAEVFDAGDGRLNLLARIPGDGSGPKPLILMHHMDIVPADPELWTHPPLGGESDGGYLWGRGAIDMKGMGILELMALIQVKRSGLVLDRDLLYLAVAEEETGGGRGAEWMAEEYWDRLDPEYVWDEGLTGTRGLFTDDGVVWGISVAEKKVLWLRLAATGTAGHASQPHDDNPVDLVTTALARQAEHRFPAEHHPVVAEIFARLGEPVANKYTNAIQRNTCSLTTLRAGVGDPPKVNVIPSGAEATIDCRLLPDVDPRVFLEQLIDIMGREPFDAGRMRLEILAEPDTVGLSTSFDSDLYRAMRDIAGEIRPGSVAVPILSPWGTDSPKFRKRGVKAYGFIPIIVEPGELARMHGIDERISHDNVGLGVRMIYRIIERLAAVR